MPGAVAGRGAVQSHRYAGFENGDDDSDDDDDLSRAFDTVRASPRVSAMALIGTLSGCLPVSGNGVARGVFFFKHPPLLQPCILRVHRPRCCTCVSHGLDALSSMPCSVCAQRAVMVGRSA